MPESLLDDALTVSPAQSILNTPDFGPQTAYNPDLRARRQLLNAGVGDGPDDDIPPLHLLLPPVDGARDQMGDNPSKDVGEDDVPDVFIQTSLSSSFTALHDILQEYRVWFDDHLPRHGRLSGHTLDPRFLTWILTVVPLVLELHLGLAVQEEQYVRDTADLLQAWLDVVDTDHPFRRRAICRLVHLATESGHFPHSLFLRGVDLGGSRDYVRVGGMADIYKATYLGRAIALKKLRALSPHDISLRKDLAREALVWRQLRHPNVLEFIGIDSLTFAATGFISLISPWMERGTLKDYIKSADYQAAEDLFRMLIESAQGLAYLHVQKIFHGDVKDVNVLITDDCHAQLCDFGLVTVGDSTVGRLSTAGHGLGSGTWMSPQRMEDGSHRRTAADDVYAFGCLAYYMFVHHPPFHGLAGWAPFRQIMIGRRPLRPSVDECRDLPMPDALWTLIETCWSHEPDDRPAIATVLSKLRAIHTPLLPDNDVSKKFILADAMLSRLPQKDEENKEDADYAITRSYLRSNGIMWRGPPACKSA